MPWPRWLTRRTRRRLALALAAAFVLPWTIGQWARVGLQPGLADEPLPDLAAVRGVIIQKAVPGRRRLSKSYL